jgi:hypothetical protein
VFVSKCRFKVFKNSKTQKVVVDAFKEVEMRYKIRIREFTFGNYYINFHVKVNVPDKLSVAQVIQILKSHSAPKVFAELLNFVKRYPCGSF